MKTIIPKSIINNSEILTSDLITNDVDSATGEKVASDLAVFTVNSKIDNFTPGGGGDTNVDVSTIKVGTTETLTPGSNAKVTGVISDDVLKLNFGIPAGFDGNDGNTPTVSVNETITVDSLTPAKVTNVGSSTEVLLNFEIPRGEKGDPGEHAIAALNPRGSYDRNAEPFYKKNDYITFENSCFVCKMDNESNIAPTTGDADDSYWQLLAIQGSRGDPGKDGLNGLAATIAVGKHKMVAYNKPLKITNSGSNTNAVLNFEIPQSFANLEIGNVESISPDETPQVLKRGTTDNIILDFKLNRGYRGADTSVGSPLNEYLVETEQVWGKWINGKTIYSYIWTDIPYNSNGVFKNGNIDINPLSIDRVIQIFALRTVSPGYFYSNAHNIAVVANIGDGNLNSGRVAGTSSVSAGSWSFILPH